MPDFYDLLEKLGYSKENSEKRLKIYDNAAKGGTLICRRNWTEDLDIEVCGSRGEGLERSLDSDFDILFIQRSVKCFESCYLNTVQECRRYSAIFALDFENVPDGYTKLRFVSMKDPDDSKNIRFLKNVRDALEAYDGVYYLTNNQVLTTAIEYRRKDNSGKLLKGNLQFDEVSGPSRPFRFKIPILDRYINADFVQALPCHFPSLVEAWCTRKRRFDWPSEALIEKVKGLDVFIVPVGKKGNKDEALQWRVSMTLAERELVRSFNDTQIKIYAAVKMIVNQELKPICADIKSYLVKNVTFWVFEETNLSEVSMENLDCLFITVLKSLRNCISQHNIRCYTMPSRNLLENKCTEQQTVQLLRQLDIIIAEGIFTLLRCPLVIELALKTRESLSKQFLTTLIDQVYLSILALDVEHMNVLELLLNNAERSEQVLSIYKAFIFPLIRDTNPFGYFNLINSMTNEQIVLLLVFGKYA